MLPIFAHNKLPRQPLAIAAVTGPIATFYIAAGERDGPEWPS